MRNKLLVIVPAYNEQGSIENVVHRICAASASYDVLVINDCSKDKTAAILREMGANYIDLPLNLGIGGAMQTGYLYAINNGYDFAIQVDGDGQHDPREISKMESRMQEGDVDMVIGSRFIKKTDYNQKFMRMLGINIFSLATRFLIGQSVKDATSGFRLANRKVIEYFAYNYPSDYPEPEVLVGLSRRNLKVVEIPVKMYARESGISSINMMKSAYYMIKVFFAMVIDKIRKV